MRLGYFFSLGMLTILLSGCGVYVNVDNNYTAGNTVRYHKAKELAIGSFTYLPYIKGELSHPTEVFLEGPETIYISVPVADLIKKITVSELEKTGIPISDLSNYVLNASVEYLRVGVVGFSGLQYTYIVNYEIKNSKDGSVLVSQKYAATPLTMSGIVGRTPID